MSNASVNASSGFFSTVAGNLKKGVETVTGAFNSVGSMLSGKKEEESSGMMMGGKRTRRSHKKSKKSRKNRKH